MRKLLYLTGILLFAVTTYAQDCNLNADAQRYWVRAKAALNDAKNENDYLIVCDEFKKALEYAPDCPDIYFNIGMCYDKSASTGLVKDIFGCKQAAEYLKKYLEIKPDAQNKREVRDKIYELEFKYDKLYNSFPFIGKYQVKGFFTLLPKFEIQMNNNRIVAIVPKNNMGTEYETLTVENYKTKEGEEILNFSQKEFTEYFYDEKKNSYDTKSYLLYSDIIYLLKFNNEFEFGSAFINSSVLAYKNNKADNKLTMSFLDQNGKQFYNKLWKADKITKIESDPATETSIPAAKQSEGEKKSTSKKNATSLGGSLFGR